MRDLSWKASRYNLFLLVNIAVYLLLSAFFFQKSMFDGGGSDGFYSQIFYVVNVGEWSTSPLYPVHLLRFLVVSPFYYLHVNGVNPIFEAALILMFLMPVLAIKFGSKRVYSQALFIYLPILFSYRSVLVMCSISYLFICLYGCKRRYWMLFLSMLLANLSSGVVLPWVLIALLNIKDLSQKYKVIWFVALGAVVVLGFSISHKVGFFFGEHAAGESVLSRSTFYVSILNEQYLRLALYSLLFLAWFVIGLASINVKPFPTQLFCFYFPAFVTFFFEGLGLISFLIPMIWFYMGIRPPFNYCNVPRRKGVSNALAL